MTIEKIKEVFTDPSIYVALSPFVFLLIPFSFRFMSLAIGRNVEMQSNVDLFAEYCGAEIKNFDIFSLTIN